MNPHAEEEPNAKTKRPRADIEAASAAVQRSGDSSLISQAQTGNRDLGLAATQDNLGSGTAKTSGEDFDNFIERLDLQEWLERLEKELNQIKAKLKG